MSQFELARRALGDLQEIWDFVAEDSFTAADRLIEDFYGAFQRFLQEFAATSRRTHHSR